MVWSSISDNLASSNKIGTLLACTRSCLIQIWADIDFAHVDQLNLIKILKNMDWLCSAINLRCISFNGLGSFVHPRVDHAPRTWVGSLPLENWSARMLLSSKSINNCLNQLKREYWTSHIVIVFTNRRFRLVYCPAWGRLGINSSPYYSKYFHLSLNWTRTAP